MWIAFCLARRGKLSCADTCTSSQRQADFSYVRMYGKASSFVSPVLNELVLCCFEYTLLLKDHLEQFWIYNHHSWIVSTTTSLIYLYLVWFLCFQRIFFSKLTFLHCIWWSVHVWRPLNFIVWSFGNNGLILGCLEYTLRLTNQLEGVYSVAFIILLLNRLNKTESGIFMIIHVLSDFLSPALSQCFYDDFVAPSNYVKL